ncbi:hypothetical protein EOL73_01220 [Candidatus Saccharibacteria bacterium]|nr:hypothetical protein [Candidatus Saccharibacteria bacterium]NCU40362.1 hypothetical protein [Candidatus Saccharibacteria bacterium]
MEPQIQGLPSPEISMDQHKSQHNEIFSGDQRPEKLSEQSRDGKRESKEIIQEGPKGDPTSATPPLPPVLDTSLVVQPTTSGTQDDNTSMTPSVAADVDLIEKEWVDRAKLIVSETRHDPHEQEVEVGKLQADYLRKRYGREAKVMNGG